MVWVVRIIVMVGVKTAVVAGPGIPGRLPVAPLNFHCPYEVMMRNKNKQTNKEPKKKKRGKSNLNCTNKKCNKKMKAACKKKKILTLPFSQWSAKLMINIRDGNFSSSQE